MTTEDGGFLDVSRQFLDRLGPDGLGSEYEQHDYAVAGREPRWVLMPATVEECAAVLRLCHERGLAVVTAGFARRLQQGRPPERLDAVLSTSRLARIVDHAAADMTLVVEAGAALADVNRSLQSSGQWLPFDPPFPQATSIGGLIATQAAGPLRQAFGTPRESLIGIRAVLADGTVVKSGGRVVKNVAGYDVHRLLAGSFGSLAVIVEASFKCRPRPEAIETTGFRGGLRDLATFAGELAGSALAPALLELVVGADEPPRLAVGFAGTPEVVASGTTRTRGLAAGRAGLVEDAWPGDAETLSVRLEAIATPDEGVLVARAGVPPRALAGWIEAALGLSTGNGWKLSGHAHAGVGVARLRIEGAEAAALPAFVAELRAAAGETGGYLVVESADSSGGIEPWGPPPASFHLFEGVKRAFDPERTLSPGRFVGGV